MWKIFSLFFITMIIIAGTFTNAIAADKLEMVWHFDEGQGDVCKEDNRTGNDGIFDGADKNKIKWVDGKDQKALQFTGQWVTVKHSDDTDIRDAITMEAWIYPTVIEGDKRTIITKAAYYLQIEPTSQVATYFYDVNPPGYHLSSGKINANEWTHVAVTYDGKEIKFYINGEEDKTVIKATGRIRHRPDWNLHLGGEEDPPHC
jgi:hypothetical protein